VTTVQDTIRRCPPPDAATKRRGGVVCAPPPLPIRFNLYDDRTSARPLDDQLAWPVPNTQRGGHPWRHRDNHSPPRARCARDRRGELEDNPRRTANSVRRDRRLRRRPEARSRLGRPARRGTRTNVSDDAAQGEPRQDAPAALLLGPLPDRRLELPSARRDRPGPGERIGPACPVVVAPEFPKLKWEDTPLTDGHKQAAPGRRERVQRGVAGPPHTADGGPKTLLETGESLAG
jgi:hypothetical protein